jgi:hypothetical protein
MQEVIVDNIRVFDCPKCKAHYELQDEWDLDCTRMEFQCNLCFTIFMVIDMSN